MHAPFVLQRIDTSCSQVNNRLYIYVYMYICVNIYIYIYMYVCMSIYKYMRHSCYRESTPRALR